jgi:hypothetical protein
MKRQVARSKTCLRLIDGLNGHPPERQRRGLLQPPAEPFDAVVARSEAVLALQVLPDPLDGQAAFQGGNDGLPERLTPTRRPRRPGGQVWPVLLAGQVPANDLGPRGPGQVRQVLVDRPGGQAWPVLAAGQIPESDVEPCRPGGQVWPVLLAGQVPDSDLEPCRPGGRVWLVLSSRPAGRVWLVLSSRPAGQVWPVLSSRPAGRVWPVLARAVVAAGAVTRAVLRDLHVAGHGLAVDAQFAGNPPLRPAAGV